ncbi:UNVERIFIED_CONTAM: hypothetical protein FKN15_075643 [Acipenser sinensis]
MGELETDILGLQQALESRPDDCLIQGLKYKKHGLVDLLGAKVQGAVVRSHFKNMVEMDAPTTFFCGARKEKCPG